MEPCAGSWYELPNPGQIEQAPPSCSAQAPSHLAAPGPPEDASHQRENALQLPALHRSNGVHTTCFGRNLSEVRNVNHNDMTMHPTTCPGPAQRHPFATYRGHRELCTACLPPNDNSNGGSNRQNLDTVLAGPVSKQYWSDCVPEASLHSDNFSGFDLAVSGPEPQQCLNPPQPWTPVLDAPPTTMPTPDPPYPREHPGSLRQYSACAPPFQHVQRPAPCHPLVSHVELAGCCGPHPNHLPSVTASVPSQSAPLRETPGPPCLLPHGDFFPSASGSEIPLTGIAHPGPSHATEAWGFAGSSAYWEPPVHNGSAGLATASEHRNISGTPTEAVGPTASCPGGSARWQSSSHCRVAIADSARAEKRQRLGTSTDGKLPSELPCPTTAAYVLGTTTESCSSIQMPMGDPASLGFVLPSQQGCSAITDYAMGPRAFPLRTQLTTDAARGPREGYSFLGAHLQPFNGRLHWNAGGTVDYGARVAGVAASSHNCTGDSQLCSSSAPLASGTSDSGATFRSPEGGSISPLGRMSHPNPPSLLGPDQPSFGKLSNVCPGDANCGRLSIVPACHGFPVSEPSSLLRKHHSPQLTEPKPPVLSSTQHVTARPPQPPHVGQSGAGPGLLLVQQCINDGKAQQAVSFQCKENLLNGGPSPTMELRSGTEQQKAHNACLELPHSQRRANLALPDDGYTWHKYGEKLLMFPRKTRCYYKCAAWKASKCKAKKIVDFETADAISALPGILYQNFHNHIAPPRQEAPRRKNWLPGGPGWAHVTSVPTVLAAHKPPRTVLRTVPSGDSVHTGKGEPCQSTALGGHEEVQSCQSNVPTGHGEHTSCQGQKLEPVSGGTNSAHEG